MYKCFKHVILTSNTGHSMIERPLGMQAIPSSTPLARHILLCRLCHENISTAILPLPLIQEEQLSANGGRMYTKYWLIASRRLAKEQCDYDN